MRVITLIVLTCLAGIFGNAYAQPSTPPPMNVCGIGAVITEREGSPVITNVLPKSPALSAGLIAYDEIVQVDDRKVEGLKLADVVNLIRGPAGTIVKIFVVRAGQHPPLSFEVMRAEVQIWTR